MSQRSQGRLDVICLYHRKLLKRKFTVIQNRYKWSGGKGTQEGNHTGPRGLCWGSFGEGFTDIDGAIGRGFHGHRCIEKLLLSIINMCGILQHKFHLLFDNFTHMYNVSCSYISSTVSSHCPQLVPFQPSYRLFCVISFCVAYTGMELLKRQKAS